MKNVTYISKPKTVKEFGCPKETDLIKWVPEICGVCCFKMIGDTLHATQNISLWQLTQLSREAGAFRERPDGVIEGIFYKPLLAVARQRGLNGTIYRWLPLIRIRHLLKQGYNPLLSIDLHKLDKKYEAGHLIVVVAYDRAAKEFIVHDPSSVLDQPGTNVRISSKQLGRLSNKRGLAFS